MGLDLEEIANVLCVLCLVFGLRLTHRLDALAFWVLLLRVVLVFLTNDALSGVLYAGPSALYPLRYYVSWWTYGMVQSIWLRYHRALCVTNVRCFSDAIFGECALDCID